MRSRLSILCCPTAVIAFLAVLFGCGGGASKSGSSSFPPPSPDFAISVSPSPATVSPGGTLQAQFSVIALDGFSGSVTVNVAGLPTGTVISPSAPFVMSPGVQNVTFTLSPNAAQGTFTIAFQATAGNLQHNTNLALQVEPLANFSVVLNNQELSFMRGGSANTSVGLSFTSGGNTDYVVEFSVLGLPTGVQATFGTNPFNAGSPATLLIFAASPSANLTNYGVVTVTATRTADGVQESAQLEINVSPPVGSLAPVRTDFVRLDGTPAAAVYDPAHNVVYASNTQWNRVDVVSPATRQIVKSVPAPSPTGMDLSLDGTHLIVTSNVQQIVSIDTNSLQVVSRTSVPPIVQGGASYAIPDLLANTSNGTSLVGMTNNSSPPSYYLEKWNQATGKFTSLKAPGIGPYINQLVRTGDGAKALVVDYGSDVNMAVYDAASDSFTAKGQSPVGQVFEVAGSPAAHQFAIVGSGGLSFVDADLDTLATLPLGGLFWGMVYSPDGSKLFVAQEEVFTVCGPNYPVLLTFDTTSYSLVGVAPAFEEPTGNPPCFPPLYSQANPLAADNSGLIFSNSAGVNSPYTHGLVIDDASNQQNLLNLPVGPPFPQISFVDEAALNASLVTGLGQISFDVLPDVWFSNTRGTNIQFNGSLVSVTAPPSGTPGLVNVKAVLPDGWLSVALQSFSYGSKILFLGATAGSEQGGAELALIGYGLIGNNGATPTVTIGGESAKVTAKSKYVDFNDSGFNAVYPFVAVDEVLVTVPPGNPGAADVTVTSEAGTATLPKAFNYIPITDYSSADTFTFVLYDPQRHWVYLSAGDHIDVFSVDTEQFLSPIVPPTISGTRQLRGLALTPDHSKLVVANWSDLSLAIINPDNPSSATAMQVVPSGLPNSPGPYAVATTSTGKVFVSTGSCIGAPVYVLDLSTLQVTTPYSAELDCGGSGLWRSASGDYVLMGNALWSAAKDKWTPALLLVNDSVAASGDGHWFASDYTFLDPQMIQHAQGQVPEFFSISREFIDWAGEKMNASGSLLYTPVPAGGGNAESNGIDITDTNSGTWLGNVLLSEQMNASQPAQSTMDFDEAGNRLLVITNKGLTVVQLPAPPLSIGYLNPVVGSSSGGTTITIRGSGFESGATVSFGGTTINATFIDAGTLQVVTPPGSAGGTSVSVQNPDGTSYSLDAAFTYQ